MVLFKRKPVQSLPNPAIQDEDQEVWVIDVTGEIFTEYDDYLQRLVSLDCQELQLSLTWAGKPRMQFYKSKRFICEISGHSGLDFFTALESELAGSKDVEESFPEPLKGPILRKVQFQTISRVDHLVDVIYDSFKGDYYPGEIVIAKLHNSDKTEGQIREKMSFPEQRSAHGDVVKPASAKYMVNLINRAEEITLSGSDITRDRRIFTKAMLRAFIKNTVYREAWNGAPWLVKDYFAKKFCINQSVPRHLQRGTTVAERKAMSAMRKAQAETGLSLASSHSSYNDEVNIPTIGNKKANRGLVSQINSSSKSSTSTYGIQPPNKGQDSPKLYIKPVIKYPLDDLLIMPLRTSPRRPDLKYLQLNVAGCKIMEESVPILLETWVFLNVYCEPFILDSFTFDDYIDAFLLNDDYADCSLLVEIHCAMLKSLVDEGEHGEVKIANLLTLPDGQSDSPTNTTCGMSENASAGKETAGPTVGLFHRRDDASDLDSPQGIPIWIEMLRKRDFKSGAWVVILVGLLNQISSETQFFTTANDIVSSFSLSNDGLDLSEARQQYRDLDVNLRIKAIQLLQKLCFETPIVRDFMDECGEAMTKLRKEKIEHQKARKIFLEESKLLEEERKLLLPDNLTISPSRDAEVGSSTEFDAKTNTTTSGGDLRSLEDEMEDFDMATRRASNRASERKRKREIEKEREEANAKLQLSATKFKKILQQIEKTRAKIKHEEEVIADLDSDLRESDCARLRLLGRDRFWNRYWFFERNGMPYGGLPTSSTADSGYAMGRLWVQGASLEEQREFLDLDAVICNETEDNTKVRISIKERRKREEGSSVLDGPDKWAYLDQPDEIQALLDWLNIHGERELKLKKELEIYKEHIFSALTARRAYIAPTPSSRDANEMLVRMSTRTKTMQDVPFQRCLRWRNSLAIERIGHSHYDQPQKLKHVRKAIKHTTRG